MPKNTNSLMKHLRDTNKIDIKGSKQKLALQNYGFYHGYKGYRFFKEKNNTLNLTNFNEIIALNEFDLELKAIFYKQIMFIETALKNRVLQLVMEDCKSYNFNDIYEKNLTFHTSIINKKVRSNALKKRLSMRQKILQVVSNNYPKNRVVTHFYDRNSEVPIWGIFELVTLGEFGYFVSCMDINLKKDFADSINLDRSYNTDGELVEKIIFLIRDLRNALSHNEVVFDTRFKTSKVSKNLISSLEKETGIRGISMETITDYLILNIYILKNLGIVKTKLKSTLSEYIRLKEKLRNEIDISDHMKIFPSDTRNKLNMLENFIKK